MCVCVCCECVCVCVCCECVCVCVVSVCVCLCAYSLWCPHGALMESYPFLWRCFSYVRRFSFRTVMKA